MTVRWRRWLRFDLLELLLLVILIGAGMALWLRREPWMLTGKEGYRGPFARYYGPVTGKWGGLDPAPDAMGKLNRRS